MERFITPVQKILLTKIPPGRILDVGGGGEGIVAQIGKERVTAVDRLESEIEEARPNAPTATWRVADARDLPFENESFDNATAFFSFMYMTTPTKKDVCKEIYRVLPPGGELWVWDANIICKEPEFIIALSIQLPNGKIIGTGYGSRQKQTSKSISEILKETRFEVSDLHSSEFWFFVKAKKPTF
ncbi:MAG: class I SAM-dependent methyltransferase [Candidatus Hodarchaeota archaeon]